MKKLTNIHNCHIGTNLTNWQLLLKEIDRNLERNSYRNNHKCDLSSLLKSPSENQINPANPYN